MKLIYSGTKKNIGHNEVLIKEEYFNDASINHVLEHIERHSPDGFQWGYGGSGPADLALSILTDYCTRMRMNEETVDLVEGYYQKFKKDFIASSPDELNITSEQIEEWLPDNWKIEK